jgi:predicted permease
VLLGVGAAAALLLLIVFSNIAGLSAARAVGQRQQVAVRLALGASSGRVMFERLIDALVLASAGSVAGVWLGDLVVTVIAAYQGQFMPRLAVVEMDWPAALGGVAVGLAAGVAAAAVPSGAGRVSSMEALRSSRGSAGSRGASAMRSALVVTQVALALVLLVGAGLLVRTVYHLSRTSLGFEPDGLTIFTVTMPVPKYATESRQLQVEKEMLDRLSRIPGVTSASASVGFPVVVSTRASLSIFGRPDEAGRDEVMYMSMSPGFVAATGMHLLEGRDLSATDEDPAPPVVLINESMARQYWPAGDAVGARVRIGPGTTGPWITVVGVVADIRQHGPTQPVIATSFGSTRQYSWPRRHFSVRTAASHPALAAELRAVVQAVDRELPMGPVQTVSDMVHTQTARHRLVMLALAFFGIVATVLSAFGLYAVVALTSQMRRREYAIRMALGAPRQGVRWLVVRQALLLAVAGAAGGVMAAALGTRALAGLLHGVTPLDGPTFAAAGLVLVMLAVLSAWIPARAAARVDPSEALRDS